MYTDRDGNADLLQEEAYYPFGMRIPSMSKSYSGSSDDRYLYNGKELEGRLAGFHFSDYGARFYDPALGRWHSVDPLAEKGREWSPYTYCFNNPMNLIDPDGRWAFWTKAKNLVYNWMGLPGTEEAEEKSSLSKDELADGTNKSEGEGIASWIALPAIDITGTSKEDATNGGGQQATVVAPPIALPVAQTITKVHPLVMVGTFALTVLKGDTPDDGIEYFYHYTNKAGLEGILAANAIFPNSKGKVYLTHEALAPADVFQNIFLSQPTHAGKGDYVISIGLLPHQVASL